MQLYYFREKDLTTITVQGLQENMTKAIALLDDLIMHCVSDETTFTGFKEMMQKDRSDAKLKKQIIMKGLMDYAGWSGYFLQ